MVSFVNLCPTLSLGDALSVKRLFVGIFIIIFGVLGFVGGVNKLMSPEVDCGGQTMSSTDICVTVDDSQRTESTIEQQERGNLVMGVGGLAVSLGIVVFGVLILRKGAQLKKAAQAGLQQPQPGAQPLQPGPQQPGQYPQQPGQHPQAPGAFQQQQPGFPPQQAAPGQGQAQPAQQPGGYPPNR